ncbi:SusC/RagA family TonB-linked outer membrane protein [Segetibacter aerophilus]|uniref:SusC/RagA family TonB-linked outer membrane protein n=1 Tax=Segetibacter aerophilus TaxID=670293 RepID=A0A512BJ18_9BACT|nr:TonB-dependent receptor [Segetibacter aerophilus]GEO11968.1 SusC/RagA family TonB-linked outer membrane protein [Segetibacter aerophilus]
MRKILLFMLLCLSFAATQVFAQTRTVTGKVTDEAGNPVVGASVQPKGSKGGTTTDAAGNFSLQLPANSRSLTISSVNYTAQDVAVTSGEVSVQLKASSGNLSEVVVVAYGTQKRAGLTGSVATIKGSDIENQPFTSVDKALQGQVAGLQSVAASGAPGSNQQIRIRGISSINASNAPLFVIDGVPANTNDLSRLTTSANILSTLNPNDIETITVLKDAASASIYGSRAANGVILVTTKKGRAGQTKFRFDTEVGQSSRAYNNDKYRPLTGDEYLAITREGLVNAGNPQATVDAQIASLGGNTNANFNWLDAVTRTGKQQQYNLSASGGNNNTTFYVSGGYFSQDGTTIATGLKRYNGAVRVTNKASERLNLGANINAGLVQQSTPSSGGAFANPVLSAYFLLPTRSAYLPDGKLNYLTAEFPNTSSFNTIALAGMDKRNLRELSLRGSAYAEYNILDNLKFKTQIGGDLSNLEEDQYNNPLYGDGAVLAAGSPAFGPNVVYNATTTGRAYAYYTRYFNWVWTNTLNYRHDFTTSGDISLNVLLGYEAQKNKQYTISAQGRGFVLSPTLYLQYPVSASTPTTSQASVSDYSFLSEFVSADFNFKDRYILSGSFRRDGSSRFGSNDKYGNFWAIGGSWNIDKEAFMASFEKISQLKLRASYGVNGNAGIGNYDFFPSYGVTTGSSYNSAPGSAPSNVGNLDLTWELNKPLNIGVDLGLLKGRLGVTIDWYRRVSDRLLLDVPLSSTTGFTSQRRNVGSMENKGFEFTVSGTPVQTRDFTWTTNFNIAYNKNKVLSIPAPIIGTFIIKEGLDVQTFYTRVYAGVDPANGDPLWYLDSAQTKTTNTYSSAVRTGYGSASPKFFGAFTNTFNYKGFSVEAQFNYQTGNYIQDAWGSFVIGAGANATFNKVARVLDRWKNPGDVTDMPKYIYGGNKSFQSFSSFYLNKGDFIRLRNLQVGYTLPKSLLASAHITNAFLYVRGTNLFTWVKDKNLGFDPEQGVSSQTNLDVFIPKTLTIGINLGF